MIKSFNGKTPKIAESAMISQAAYIIGDVEIAEDCTIWPGVMVRADFASIKIGRNTDIEDNTVLHVKTEMEIGENVVIGHSVVIHCRKIGNNTIVGNNATLLDHSEIGKNCVIAAGSVVTGNSRVPDGSFVAGVPAEIRGEASAEQKALVNEHYRYYTKEYKKLYKDMGI